MSFALRSGPPLFAGLERRFMSLGEGCREPGLPTSHYFLSLSRGDAIRTVMLRPAGLWAIAALTALLFVWASAVSAYIALHDDLLSAVVARQGATESAYESRLAEARARTRRGRRPARARPQIVRAQAQRTRVPAGPAREARRGRRRARRRIGRAQPVRARRPAGAGVPSRCARRNSGSRAAAASRRRRRLCARLCASAWPQRRAEGAEAASGR